MASYPVTKSYTSLVADLRTQLFGVKGELERERNERISTAERVIELEAQLSRMRMEEMDFTPPVSTTVIPPTPLSAKPSFPYAPPAIMPEASLPSPDLSQSRMRSWGFPQGPPRQTPPKNRESFFGLSQMLRRGSTEDEREEVGLDLPPFLLTPASNVSTDPFRSFPAVSEPTPNTTPATSILTPSSEKTQRSASLTSSASSALSFFSGYLPGRSIPKSASPPLVDVRGVRAKRDTVQRLPSCTDKGFVDFTRGCKCCQGEVIQL